MGISANQARLLTLTARQHDLELRAQQISAQKMALMFQSQAQATNYANALAAYTSNGAFQVNGTYQEVQADINAAYFTRTENKSKTLYNFSTNTEATAENLADDAAITSLIENGYELAIKRAHRTNASTLTTSDNAAMCAAIKKAFQDRQDAAYGSHWEFDVVGFQQEGNLFYPILDTTTIVDARPVAYTCIPADDQHKYLTTQDILNNVVAWEQTYDVGHDSIEKTDFARYFLTVDDTTNPGMILVGTPYVMLDNVDTTGNNNSNEDVYYTYDRIPMTTTVFVPSNETNTAAVDMEAAKAAYDAAMVELSSTEKLLDMELTQIDTEHKAVTTEYDAVKSLVKDNTEKSFNVFG